MYSLFIILVVYNGGVKRGREGNERRRRNATLLKRQSTVKPYKDGDDDLRNGQLYESPYYTFLLQCKW